MGTKAIAITLFTLIAIAIAVGSLALGQRETSSSNGAYAQAPTSDCVLKNEPTPPPPEDYLDYDSIIENELYDTYYTNGYDYCDSYVLCFVPIFTSEPLPEHIIEFITGRTFRDYAPFTTDFLTYLTITHVDFDGNDRIGHMIVAAEIGDEVLEIFREIYESHFPIYSIRLIDYFDAIDYYSLAANNSSAFNFRYIANTNVISRHGFGMAIDINPIQNPYVRGDVVLPEAGRAYLDRTDVRPGMIVAGCPVYQAFISRDWIWGGNWTLPRDYHHFEKRN